MSAGGEFRWHPCPVYVDGLEGYCAGCQWPWEWHDDKGATPDRPPIIGEPWPPSPTFPTTERRDPLVGEGVSMGL